MQVAIDDAVHRHGSDVVRVHVGVDLADDAAVGVAEEVDLVLAERLAQLIEVYGHLARAEERLDVFVFRVTDIRVLLRRIHDCLPLCVGGGPGRVRRVVLVVRGVALARERGRASTDAARVEGHEVELICSACGNVEARSRKRSTPESPGPPKFTMSTPSRLAGVSAFCRINATLMRVPSTCA